MKKLLILLAFMAWCGLSVYGLIEHPKWFIGGYILSIVFLFVEKPFSLDPNDPAFD